MLDWTTSFLSDAPIIKPRASIVKLFLPGYNIQGYGGVRLLDVDVCGSENEKEAPHTYGASDEKPNQSRQLPRKPQFQPLITQLA
jgi:hypothetical protein